MHLTCCCFNWNLSVIIHIFLTKVKKMDLYNFYFYWTKHIRWIFDFKKSSSCFFFFFFFKEGKVVIEKGLSIIMLLLMT